MTEQVSHIPNIDIPQQPDVALQVSFPCPACDRVFDTAAGLQGHSMMHKPVVPCPECGKEYKTPGALGNHRKMAHGVEGPWAAAKRARDQELKPLGRPKKAHAKINAELRADDIFEAAINVLWPSGMMPVRAMTPLIEWRAATVEFLERINRDE